MIDRVPAPVLFISQGLVQFYGAALAMSLFAIASPHSVSWARIAIAGLMLMLWRRPWTLRWTPRELLASTVLGLCLGGMGMLFYASLAHIPLGVSSALGFIGPVVLVVWSSRTLASWISIVLMVIGVVAVSGVVSVQDSASLNVIGVLLGAGAGAVWACYLVLGRRIANQRDGQASLAVALVGASVVYAPIGAPASGAIWTSPSLLATAVAVALMASVIPYVLDQVALRRLSTHTHAVLTSLLPVTATVVGALALRQIPTIPELVGVLAISGSVALTAIREKSPPRLDPPVPGPGPG